MKPAPFTWHAPTDLAEVLALLAAHGDEAKVLAGGQSLVPTMSFRLAQPAVLIDLNRVAGLAGIRTEGSELRLGAMTRQRAVERSALVAERAPLVSEAMPFIAHPQIRNRGTFGGSLAHADPSAELPAVLLALGGRCRVARQGGERWIAAEDLYTGLFATALAADELLVEVALPNQAPRTGWAFTEVSRRHGDYALVGAAALVTLDEQGRCTAARVTWLSVGEGPVASRAVQGLLGEAPTAAAIRAVAEAAAVADVDPPSDIHASAAYRRQLVRVLTARVLTTAVERAAD